MEIPEHIKRFAKKEGYPEVTYVGPWNGFTVYCAADPDFPYEGLPQFIVSSGDKDVRWATIDETDSIMETKA